MFQKEITKKLILILFVVLNGILYFLPEFYQKFLLDYNGYYLPYHAVHFNENYEEILYGPYVRRFFDLLSLNSFNFANYPISKEIFTDFNIFFFPLLFGGMFSVLTLGVENFYFIKNLFFCASIFFITFKLVNIIFEKFYFSLFGSLIISNHYFSLSNLYKYLLFDHNLWTDKTHLNIYAIKFPSQLNIIIFLSSIFFLIKIIKNPEDLKSSRLLLLSIFLLSLSYLFHLIIISFLVLLYFIYGFFLKKNYYKRFLKVGITSLFFVLPILYFAYNQEYKSEFLLSIGFTKSYSFDYFNFFLRSFLVVFVLIFLSLFSINQKKDLVLIFLFLLIPGLIITFFSYHYFIIPEPQHFNIYYTYSKNFSLLFLLNFIIDRIYNKKKLIFLFYFSLIYVSLSLFISTFSWQINNMKKEKDIISYQKKDILQWIKDNTEKSSIILAMDPFLLNTIPVITGRYNYLPSKVSLTGFKIEDSIYRFIEISKIIELNKSLDTIIENSCDQNKVVDRDYIDFCYYFYHSYFKIDKGSYSYYVYNKLINFNKIIPEKNKSGMYTYYEFKKKLNLKFKNKNLDDNLRTNYIIINKNGKFVNKIINKNFLTILYQNADYIIYKYQ